jgi:uncharacterized membrane protein (UPF0127 family)
MNKLLRISVGLSIALLPIAACHAGGTPTAANTGAQEEGAGLETAPLSITTAKGERRFTVEIAASPSEQERGLMFRRSLAADRGMIFPMLPARHVSFWMKNTYIPLDLIFIRANGTIARIAANATPESLDIIPSGEAVIAVLEIAGGQAAAQGIGPNDTVALPF